MTQNALAIPFFGMMMLTILVWLTMYVRRLTFILSQGIPAQELTTPEKLNHLLPEQVNASSNNLKNLFELPVLFYGVCLFQFIQGEPTVVVLTSAYVFLIFRVLHSLIHCTLNLVLLRFAVYVVSSLALFAMVLAKFIEIALP